MYAIIETGGEQLRVSAGDIITVEKVDGELNAEITIDKVLMINNDGKSLFGKPYIEGASVNAEIVNQGRSDKVAVMKSQSKKATKKVSGHRQHFSALKITKIIGG
jgi:large subunit ribosomal protein L21